MRHLFCLKFCPESDTRRADSRTRKINFLLALQAVIPKIIYILKFILIDLCCLNNFSIPLLTSTWNTK